MVTFRLGTTRQYGEHHFADSTWLQLSASKIRLIKGDNKLITPIYLQTHELIATLHFRSSAAAAEAWPILCALPSAAARFAQGVR